MPRPPFQGRGNGGNLSHLEHIILSDLHAGAPACLAHEAGWDGSPAAPGAEGPVTRAFADALARLVQGLGAGETGPPVRLTGMGDMLDLAFASRARAAAGYAAWLGALHGAMGPALQADMTMVPGNRDHSLWTAARHAAESAAAAAGRPWGMPRATPAFGEGLPSPALAGLQRTAGISGAAMLHYPNLALRRADGRRVLVLHHGHFCDPPFSLPTTAAAHFAGRAGQPPTAEDLAGGNAGWIEFAWSSFAEDSTLAPELAALYDDAQLPGEAQRMRRQAATLIARSVSRRLPMTSAPQVRDLLLRLISAGLDVTLGAWGGAGRAARTEPLSPGQRAGLEAYLAGPVAAQLAEGDLALDAGMVFLFGHTHKPFSGALPAMPGRPAVRVGNTGGWTLTGTRLDTSEGAAVALVDDALNVVLLRCFSAPLNGEAAPATARLVSAPDAAGLAFLARVEARIAADAAAWTALSREASAAYTARQSSLLRRLTTQRGAA